MRDQQQRDPSNLTLLQSLSSELVVAIFFKLIFGYKSSDTHDNITLYVFHVLIDTIKTEFQKYNGDQVMVFQKWYPDVLNVSNAMLDHEMQLPKRVSETLNKIIVIVNIMLDRQSTKDSSSANINTETKRGGDFEFIISEDARSPNRSPSSMSFQEHDETDNTTERILL